MSLFSYLLRLLRSMTRKRRFGIFIISSFVACLLSLQLSAENIYRTSSSIVIDAETNNVLFDDGADDLAYPASLTKTMTLLLLFDQLKNNTWQTSTLLSVSPNAAKRPKTRLGLRAGDKISVDLAIRSIVVLSANDSAVVVAENIAGSEDAFARRMTARAKEIGMNQTRFNNASGLPSKGQITTARDMAMLGLYILNSYPEYYHYFSINSFVFKNRTILTHNRVLERFNGADGFKTGFIARSGYNLLTSAERNGKRVVAVVLGGTTASQRDSTMTFLLDRYIPYASNYTPSFNLASMKLSNSTPQESLKDAYKKYIKPPETVAEKKARLERERVALAAKKRKERLLADIKKREALHANILAAGKPANTKPKTAMVIPPHQKNNKVVNVANNKKTSAKKAKRK